MKGLLRGGLLAVALGALYLFLATPTTAAVGFFLAATALVALAWPLDERLEADGWIKLASVMVASLFLLAGKDWLGQVPWQSLVFTLVTILIFVLFALGLNLEFGFGGLINFGHVAFMALGAYAAALLAVERGLWTTQWGLGLTLFAAMGVAALFGLLLTLPAVRLREDYLAIVTIAAAEILRRVLNTERDLTRGASGIDIAPAERPLSIAWMRDQPVLEPVVGALGRAGEVLGFPGSVYLLVLVALLVLAVVAVVLVVERLVQSPWGRVVRAIREDEDAARALGVNPVVYKLQLLGIGSAIAGLAGVFLLWHLTFIVPTMFEPIRTFWAWIMIIIGGLGNNKGAVAGAFIFLTINQLSLSVAGLQELGFSSEQMAAFAPFALGALLVVFMVFKPEGLFGSREELELVE